ncbi:MAG: shikimate dehydrogenase [Rhodospirillaceae bacterium]|nr:shikimate dehydrogenase [Rhodospirillaceae bacterium]|tara:strand:+ start:376 stop:1233 length:858 start_codon:yes stop_codon:yes gene_type:complete
MHISGKTMVVGIIGCPVEHSLSPAIHNYLMNKHSIDGVYVPLPVSHDKLDSALAGLSSLGLSGANLTVPYKSTVLPFLDRIDTTAKKIGAVNTVRVNANKKLEGTNTDSSGFLTAVVRHSPEGWDLYHKPCVVIGAGGAARAVVYALKKLHPSEIRIVNRSFNRATELASDFGTPCRPYNWKKRNIVLNNAALLVNTTKCGMVGEPELKINLSALPTNAVVNDIVYNPLKTTLLRNAESRGNAIIDGTEMLLNQAGHAFKYWFGIDPEMTDDWKKRIKSMLTAGQ